MDMTITLGWWIIPLLLTAPIAWAFFREPDPLVGAMYIITGTGLICFIWMVYFGIGWASA